MKLFIDNEQLVNMKKEAKKAMTHNLKVLLILYVLLLLLYLVLCIIYEPKITSGLIVIVYSILIFGLLIFLINKRINKFFKEYYIDGINYVCYEVKKNYLLINNTTTNKRIEIDRISIKKVFYRSKCTVIMLKNRNICVVPNELDISLMGIK